MKESGMECSVRKGRPNTAATPIKERLLSAIVVDESTGCWNWTRTHYKGYGKLIVGSRSDGSRQLAIAPRVSFEAFVGPIPEGLWVLHKCDNPPCINPDHLFLGTNSDNVADKVRKGRQHRAPGALNYSSKLTETDVISAKRLRSKGWTLDRIAERFSVRGETIRKAVTGKSWAYLGEKS